MSEIEAKRKELGDEAKSDLEMGTKDKAWQIEYIASKNMLDGFNLACEMKDKECKEKLKIARKDLIKNEIEWLDYTLREMDISLGVENFIHRRIMFLKQSLEEKK